MKSLRRLIFTFVLLISVTLSAIPLFAASTLTLHFLDVGQADSILVQTPNGHNMLIDAGNNEDADFVTSYLSKHGVKKLDVVVGTHPHEDHIGSLDTVISKFQIGQVYLPKVTTNTKTFRDVLAVIQQKGLKVNTAKGGVTLNLDPALQIQMFAPNSERYDDLNNYSAVIKITYRKNAFLLTGDAENVSEAEMLQKGYNLKADLLKVGHHGSQSSTTEKFLTAVGPKYAVISVGQGNSYGHPKASTLERLQRHGVAIYRTDQLGTIVVTSDGESIKIDKKASSNVLNSGSTLPVRTNSNRVASEIDNQATTVYITRTGRKYHRLGCRSLAKSCIPVSLKDAKTKGYTACKACNPPQ